MSTFIGIVICMAVGYLIGTINPAYLIAKSHGFDIRERGSGNAGASNVVITMGKAAGLFTALFDISKAFIAVRLARHLFPSLLYAEEIAGVCVVLGHIFPFSMGFRGGKGLACLGGVVLAFDSKVFLIMLIAEIILVLIVDYICVIPLTVSVTFPIVYYFLKAQLLGTVLYALLAPVIFWKHAENLKRIHCGMEAHFSYLWRKEEEIERLTQRKNELNQ